MKKINLKETFFFRLFTNIPGILFIVIVVLLIIFRDFSCNRKVVKMKEDVMYIKPTSNIEKE